MVPTIWKFTLLLLLSALFFFPNLATAAVLTADAVWQGDVTLAEDILVPAGITLTIRPGTVINVLPSESTKTDPEYASAFTEITVRGTLKVDGSPASPVVFQLKTGDKADYWAGIIVDGGSASIRGCRITRAEAAIYVIDGHAGIDDCQLEQNRYGISAVGKKASVSIGSSRVVDNDYGIFALGGAKLVQRKAVVLNNRKKNLATLALPMAVEEPLLKTLPDRPVGKIYGDQVLLGSTIWQGHIVVKGIIRVPEGSRLVIMPGTLVEFARWDSNGDGIGEYGLLVQGVILAKGTPADPIVFRSAEQVRHQGDWDAINIMNSDGPQNLIEYCVIEDAYRALHFHFSNVAVTNTVLRHNYRGMQFQESAVALRGNRLYGNKSGIQGRNSTVTMWDNIISGNYLGGNFFRSNLLVKGNRFVGNLKEGLRLREGAAVVEENLFDGNRYGLMVADTFAGRFTRNVVTGNAEVGFSIKNADNIDFSFNYLAGNGFNGMNLQEARADIHGNQFAANGERGIGILSFTGTITDNNFLGNGLYAIDHEGKNRIDASRNWWGNADPEAVILDGRDDPVRGKVLAVEPRKQPAPFVWPLGEISRPTAWSGHLVVDRRIAVALGATLTILPGTRIAFAEGAGMTVYGKLVAKGEQAGGIVFTSLEKREPGAWDEVLLEHAGDSVIANATFEYANWGLHSHFTNLSLSDSQFSHNGGGLRFRSGPVLIRGCTFSDNTIGLRSYMGNGIIQGNNFTGNGIGIFIREKGSGIRINGNNLYGNTGYNLRIGDFNNEDVDARQNWWGNLSPAMAIFDGRSEPGIGNVIFEPYLEQRVAIPLPGGSK
jgi:nitrous oxidase accessory protein NosD